LEAGEFGFENGERFLDGHARKPKWPLLAGKRKFLAETPTQGEGVELVRA